MNVRRLTALLAVLLGLVALAFVLAGLPQTGTAPPDGGRSGPAPSATVSQTPTSGRAPAAGVANPSRLPEIKASDLPAEARQTLALIARGGPYPYSRDNVTFGNFERILPRKASGYYREFTVRTPGESDRGARRIVAGAAGEKYYTADHYETFKFIAEGK
ncbi:ribonuclease domain-containing protein [Arthrobacter sp. C9C5]|uniref:ribonuclease domain-containing protein n=1 Tax=Arthrobacter sp. C9C5 TaxID=2735267 RepID=UPI0015857013|nr:ribonuclease domain-containing protein [Arthrobacter sp. C9C5]NUU33301.1 ribonuclease [Arthrobacter sp. C9C5]